MTNLAEAGAAPAATPPSKLPAMPVIPVKYETIDPASRARRSSVSDSHQLFIGSDNVVVEKENVEATPKETTVKVCIQFLFLFLSRGSGSGSGSDSSGQTVCQSSTTTSNHTRLFEQLFGACVRQRL